MWQAEAAAAAAAASRAALNPNHPWVGGPPYVNMETGETRDGAPEGFEDLKATNPNYPWSGGPPYVNLETGETRDGTPEDWDEAAVGLQRTGGWSPQLRVAGLLNRCLQHPIGGGGGGGREGHGAVAAGGRRAAE